MSTVLFRCDATVRGGIGHFVRTLALAQELAARGRRAVISGDIEAELAQEMLRGTGIVVLPAAKTSDELLAQAAAVRARVVHLDRYEGFPRIRAAADSEDRVISTATDAEYGRRSADVIVDGSPRATREFDELYGDADVCLGSDHVLLRRELVGAVDDQADVAEAGGLKVLVLMGGTDAAGYGIAVARAAVGTPGVARVGLVGATEATPRVASVPRLADLPSLVSHWDFVITAAGTTVWELAAMGIPMALVGVAENQRDHYDTLLAEGAAIGLGFLPPIDGVSMAELARVAADPSARRAIAERARVMVDGRGAARVVDVWDAVLRDRGTSSLELRPAELRDAGRLYAWRNDPSVRRQSRNTTPLRWSDHLSWLTGALSRPDRRLLVATRRRPVGTVRLDALSPGEWEISVTVAPGERGRGIGGSMIDRALASMAPEAGNRVVAELRESNAASRALFRRAGFLLDGSADGWERWAIGF